MIAQELFQFLFHSYPLEVTFHLQFSSDNKFIILLLFKQPYLYIMFF